MKNDDAQFETIHSYLLGELSEAEKAAFETQLSTDPALREALAIERVLFKGIQKVGDEKLRRAIQKTQSELRGEGFFESNRPAITHRPTFFTMKKFFALAAALAAVIAAVFFFTPKKTTPAKAFVKMYYPPVSLMKTRSAELASSGFAGALNGSDSLKMAIDLQIDGKYDESIGLLNAFLAGHPGDDEATFWLAIAHLNRERYARAIELFSPLLLKKESPLRADAIWYSGLCLLKTDGGKADAVKLFQQLEGDAAYSKMAREMLDLLAVR